MERKIYLRTKRWKFYYENNSVFYHRRRLLKKKNPTNYSLSRDTHERYVASNILEASERKNNVRPKKRNSPRRSVLFILGRGSVNRSMNHFSPNKKIRQTPISPYHNINSILIPERDAKLFLVACFSYAVTVMRWKCCSWISYRKL